MIQKKSITNQDDIKAQKMIAEFPNDQGLQKLQEFSNISLLDLTATEITDEGLKNLLSLPNLRHLYLECTSINDMGLEYLQGVNLETLSLAKTNISDLGLKHLPNFPNLTWLDLTETKITNTGLEDIKRLDNISLLSLENTIINDVGLEYITELKNLTELYLGYTNISKKGLEYFKNFDNLVLYVTGLEYKEVIDDDYKCKIAVELLSHEIDKFSDIFDNSHGVKVQVFWKFYKDKVVAHITFSLVAEIRDSCTTGMHKFDFYISDIKDFYFYNQDPVIHNLCLQRYDNVYYLSFDCYDPKSPEDFRSNDYIACQHLRCVVSLSPPNRKKTFEDFGTLQVITRKTFSDMIQKYNSQGIIHYLSLQYFSSYEVTIQFEIATEDDPKNNLQFFTYEIESPYNFLFCSPANIKRKEKYSKFYLEYKDEGFFLGFNHEEPGEMEKFISGSATKLAIDCKNDDFKCLFGKEYFLVTKEIKDKKSEKSKIFHYFIKVLLVFLIFLFFLIMVIILRI